MGSTDATAPCGSTDATAPWPPRCFARGSASQRAAVTWGSRAGRSKGCAFVRYYTKEAANAAVQTLNGSMALPGAARNLVVKYADASEPRMHRSGGGNAGGGMRFAGDQQGMANHHMAQHLPSHLSHAAGQYPPSNSMGGEAQWMMQGGAGQRMMGGHGQSGAQMQMMPGAQMVGMALMPQMAMVGGHVGTPMMMASPYGGGPMDGSMGMMHPAMATSFPVPQQHTAQVQQYTPVYPEHAPPLLGNQASGQAPGGGVWDGSQSAAAGGGFTALGDSSAMDHYGGHRTDGGLAGGFSAVPHHACGGGGGGGGGGGSFGSVGMGGGMSGLERRMASVALSPDDPSPPGSSWDRLCKFHPAVSCQAYAIPAIAMQVPSALQAVALPLDVCCCCLCGSLCHADVSNLPKSYTEVDVQRLFGPYGVLTEVACHKRSDGQSKGCFFVTFATSMEGQQVCLFSAHRLLYDALPRASGSLPPYPFAWLPAASHRSPSIRGIMVGCLSHRSSVPRARAPGRSSTK